MLSQDQTDVEWRHDSNSLHNKAAAGAHWSAFYSARHVHITTSGTGIHASISACDTARPTPGCL